jgi:preprotein translocase subunit SecG
MLFGLMITLFVILCFVIILLVLIQKGKSSIGIGGMGGGTQALFGGSGGQDTFQKVTWVLGALFMGGSLVLAITKKEAASALLDKVASSESQFPATTEKAAQQIIEKRTSDSEKESDQKSEAREEKTLPAQEVSVNEKDVKNAETKEKEPKAKV